VPNDPDAAVRLGVVGGGLIAQLAHLPALRGLDARFAVVALADPGPDVRDALARRHGIPATFAGHAALLDRAELDALLVCSPNGTHARAVLDALDAGLHVLVEKPLCLDPADARAIVERARHTRRVVQVGYMKRFDPAYERLLEQLPGAGPLRLAASATVDPGIGERLRPAGFVADVAASARDDAAAQVASALGTDDPRHVTPFSDAFLGARTRARWPTAPGRARTARAGPPPGCGRPRPARSARTSRCTAPTPSRACASRPRTWVRPRPSCAWTASRSGAGASRRTPTCASSSTSTRASRAGRRAGRRPSRALATSSC